MTHLLYSLLYGQEVSIGPSVVQNIPCRRKGPEKLHLYGGSLYVKNDENSETKRREKQRIFAWDRVVSNVNQSSRRGLSPY